MRASAASAIAEARNLPPGSLLARVVAFVVDVGLLSPILTGLCLCWVALFQVDLPTERLPFLDRIIQLGTAKDPMVAGGLVFLVGVWVLYFLLGPLILGTTPGLLLMGLTLVDEQERPIGAAAATARALGSVLSMAYFGLGFLWILFDPSRQGFHDRIAGTWVVRRKAR